MLSDTQFFFNKAADILELQDKGRRIPSIFPTPVECGPSALTATLPNSILLLCANKEKLETAIQKLSKQVEIYQINSV